MGKSVSQKDALPKDAQAERWLEREKPRALVLCLCSFSKPWVDLLGEFQINMLAGRTSIEQIAIVPRLLHHHCVQRVSLRIFVLKVIETRYKSCDER